MHVYGHQHNVYVAEAIDLVIEALRREGFEILRAPPLEHIQTYGLVVEGNKIGPVISNCGRLREQAQGIPEFLVNVPGDANTCIQMLSVQDSFDILRGKIHELFNIVRDCSFCDPEATGTTI